MDSSLTTRVVLAVVAAIILVLLVTKAKREGRETRELLGRLALGTALGVVSLYFKSKDEATSLELAAYLAKAFASVFAFCCFTVIPLAFAKKRQEVLNSMMSSDKQQ